MVIIKDDSKCLHEVIARHGPTEDATWECNACGEYFTIDPLGCVVQGCDQLGKALVIPRTGERFCSNHASTILYGKV